jgi:hypothetical protein
LPEWRNFPMSAARMQLSVETLHAPVLPWDLRAIFRTSGTIASPPARPSPARCQGGEAPRPTDRRPLVEHRRYQQGWPVEPRSPSPMFRVARRRKMPCLPVPIRRVSLAFRAPVSPLSVTAASPAVCPPSSAMTSRSLSWCPCKVNIARFYCRPRSSNDNAVSESRFKTLKYGPEQRVHRMTFSEW